MDCCQKCLSIRIVKMNHHLLVCKYTYLFKIRDNVYSEFFKRELKFFFFIICYNRYLIYHLRVVPFYQCTSMPEVWQVSLSFFFLQVSLYGGFFPSWSGSGTSQGPWAWRSSNLRKTSLEFCSWFLKRNASNSQLLIIMFVLVFLKNKIKEVLSCSQFTNLI